MGAALAKREILTSNPHSALRAATRGSERLAARRRDARRRRMMSRVDVRDRVVVVMRRMRTDCERQGAYPRELRGWVPPIVGAVRLEWVSGPMRRVYGECAAIAAVDVIVAQHAAVSSDDFDCALRRMRAPYPIASSSSMNSRSSMLPSDVRLFQHGTKAGKPFGRHRPLGDGMKILRNAERSAEQLLGAESSREFSSLLPSRGLPVDRQCIDQCLEIPKRIEIRVAAIQAVTVDDTFPDGSVADYAVDDRKIADVGHVHASYARWHDNPVARF